MKYSLITFAVLAYIGNATAGTAIVVGAGQQAAPMATPATVSQPKEINPYTGVRTGIEQTKLQIEQAGLSAELSTKQLEADKAAYLLSNKDKIFKKEMSEKLSVGTGSMGSNPIILDYPNAPTKGKKIQKMDFPAPSLAAAPVVPAGPKLLGVIDKAGKRMAVIQSNGETKTVAKGDMFAGRKIGDVDTNSVDFGGQKLALSSSVTTMENPDKQSLGNAAAGGKGDVPPSGNPYQAVQPAMIQPSTNGFPMM